MTLFQAVRSFFDGIDFLDLFLPMEHTAKSRAQAFLWLCFHYLEEPTLPNPFTDEYASANTGKAPRLILMTEEEKENENKDSPEEIAFGERMTEHRRRFLNPPAQAEGASMQGEMTFDDADSASGSASVAAPVRAEKKKDTVVRLKMKSYKEPSSSLTPLDKDPDARGNYLIPQRELYSLTTLRIAELSRKTSHQRLLPDVSHQAAAGEPYPRLPIIQPAPSNVAGRAGTPNATAPVKQKRQRRSKAATGHGTRGQAAREIRRIEPVQYITLPPEPERSMLEREFY